VPADDITTPELTRSLAASSTEIGRQVGVLVHRSGQVDYVVVGDASKLMLPDIGRLRAADGRFRGLRLVHTHLRGEGLTRDDFAIWCVFASTSSPRSRSPTAESHER
jgi:GTP-binding protein HflX